MRDIPALGRALGPVFSWVAQRWVVAGKHEVVRNWLRWFFGFIKPKKVDQAVRADVEAFLTSLAGQGKPAWQVAQGSLAELFYREVLPCGILGGLRTLSVSRPPEP